MMLGSHAKYRSIGKGFCGSVWTLEGDDCTAIKREDGGPGRSVTNDYYMHLRVLQSSLQHTPTLPLLIPQCHELIQPTDSWWQMHLPQFPADYSACRALISERIPKVPRLISDKIVDLFCVGNTRLSDFVKNNPDDDACLIRPYLGRRRRKQPEERRKAPFQRFSLRNVPFHLDQMEALGLDVKSYAEAMADGLALMHWGACVDANDVEFVLAPPRRSEPSQPAFTSDYLGTHCMWILDFDCCRSLTMDDAGIEQACAAFFRNDPFYPRPGSGNAADEELWEVFKQRFLLTSGVILGYGSGDGLSLAEKLLLRIEEEGQLIRRRKEELLA